MALKKCVSCRQVDTVGMLEDLVHCLRCGCIWRSGTGEVVRPSDADRGATPGDR
jgi:hypothetical protein